MFKKRVFCILLLICFCWNNVFVFAVDTKYPDYAYEFLGEDKYENFNRKMFRFNQKLNKYAIRPIHTIWSSIMPVYGMDRINGITNNIEYPIRLMSSLIQGDFQNCKNESIRFFTNTILGVGGMFDPAKRFLNIEQSKENMEQALAKCHVKSGAYFVAPIISFTDIRGLVGKLLDTALNPSSYIGSPIIAAVKAVMTINRTSYIQPLLKMVESNYADPYEITKKAYGIDSYIKQSNLDRVDVMSNLKVIPKEIEEDKIKNETNFNMEVSSEVIKPNTYYVDTNEEILAELELAADMKLAGYNPQCPVVDSMRTALFSQCNNNSIWNELSIWNRSFGKKIKSSYINIADGKEDYKFKYIMQKEKTTSPLVIIYPSIGEGVEAEHSVSLAKLFYDAGYSVIIQGSHFQWEFVKSMPSDYHPGLPKEDAKVLKSITAKIIAQIEDKYNCKFEEKVFIGTSFGAMTSLFIAASEAENNTLGNTKFISICPPINLIYAMEQVDKASEDWINANDDLKQKVASAAAKVVKLYQSKKELDDEINNLPFSEEEGKLITGFVMHQKLSDLIYTLESNQKNPNSEIYNKINNMGYKDYASQYLIKDKELDEIAYNSSLDSISKYLKNGENYKIYHSTNDYLTNKEQLKNLKNICKNHIVLLDNGSHLGFLYRKEFINDLKNTIALN